MAGGPVDVPPIGRIVVFNRLDYHPGLHNADNLRILTSEDGKSFTLRHENKGNISGASATHRRWKSGSRKAKYAGGFCGSRFPCHSHLLPSR